MPHNNTPTQTAVPQPVSWTYALPFFAALFGVIATQKPLTTEGHALADPSQGLTYQVLFGTAYFFALVLLLRRLPESLSLLRNNLIYVLLLCYALASGFWSEFPLKVVVVWGHYVGTMLICMAAVLAFEKHPHAFFKMLVVWGLIMTIASVVLVFSVPALGISTADHVRWNGITGNPNTLGLVSMVSVWAAASYYQYASKLRSKLLSLVLLAVAGMCLYGSNSVTSIMMSVFIVVAAFAFVGLQRSTAEMRAFKIVAWTFGGVVAIFSIYTVAPHSFSEKWIFDNVGRSSTLTGRETLWELARKAIDAKPLLGWSFDALTSISKNYDLRFGQLHNGYFDLAVRGGYVGVFFIAYFAGRSVLTSRSLSVFDPRLTVLLAAMLIAILLHNLTEASLVRSPHTLWTIFTFAYLYLHRVSRNAITTDTAS